MPCYDGRAEQALNEERKENTLMIKVLATRLNQATRLLCSLTDHLALDEIEDSGLRTWVERHRREDREREIRKEDL